MGSIFFLMMKIKTVIVMNANFNLCFINNNKWYTIVNLEYDNVLPIIQNGQYRM